MTDVLMKRGDFGMSLVVWWLGLHASTAGVQFRHLVGDLRSHMPCSVARKIQKRKPKAREEPRLCTECHKTTFCGSFTGHI